MIFARNFAVLLLLGFIGVVIHGFELSQEQEEGMPDFGNPEVNTPVFDGAKKIGSSNENLHTWRLSSMLND